MRVVVRLKKPLIVHEYHNIYIIVARLVILYCAFFFSFRLRSRDQTRLKPIKHFSLFIRTKTQFCDIILYNIQIYNYTWYASPAGGHLWIQWMFFFFFLICKLSKKLNPLKSEQNFSDLIVFVRHTFFILFICTILRSLPYSRVK